MTDARPFLAAARKIVPGNVTLETGLVHRFDGGFVRDAPNSDRPGDSSFAYAALTFAL